MSLIRITKPIWGFLLIAFALETIRMLRYCNAYGKQISGFPVALHWYAICPA